MSHGDTVELFESLAAGDAWAAEEMDRRFRQQLIRLVERQLDRRIQVREDPEDIVQSALRTFFRRTENGDFEIKNRGDVWKLICTITRRKILKHAEYHNAQKRSPRVEVPSEDYDHAAPELTDGQARVLGEALEQVVDGMDPLESEIFRLQVNGYRFEEILQVVLGSLKPPYPMILALRLQGLSEREVADRLDLTREAVRFRLGRIREILSQRLGDLPTKGDGAPT